MKPAFALLCFYTDENKILLQYRKSINKWNSDWGIFGGHINDNESDIEAVIREVQEELAMKVEEKDLIRLGTVKTPVGEAYTSIFLSKLTIDVADIKVVEGDGCSLFSEEECSKLELHPGDVFRTKLIFSFLKLTGKK